MNNEIKISLLDKTNYSQWDEYVSNHPLGNYCHLTGWREVIRSSYGHPVYYLKAFQHSGQYAKLKKEVAEPMLIGNSNSGKRSEQIVGILPLVHIRSPIFGNKLVSVPFLDMGGVIASDDDVAQCLIDAAAKLALQLQAKSVELRQETPLKYLEEVSAECETGSQKRWFISKKITEKVRIVLKLTPSSEQLLKSFKSKLRSQIMKPLKEGLCASVGGSEMVDQFYQVFASNMRDLGSPVHSKKVVEGVMNEFGDSSRIFLILANGKAVAGSVALGFRNTFVNPWASSLKAYRKMSPNMLLYWTMLEYACNKGFEYFDFGRSSPGDSTYNFKKQWGGDTYPLNWYRYVSHQVDAANNTSTERDKFLAAVKYWQKIPVPITKLIGPMIRKYISL